MGSFVPQVITETKASGAQVIDGSLKFDQSNKTYLKRTPGSAGNRRTWTYSAWIKRGDLASSERGLFSSFGSSHPTTALKFGSSHVLEFLDYQSGYICQKITSQVFRDTGWYHIVVAIDTTLSTAEDRYKLYVNGERVTSFGTNTNISTQNQELDWNSATEHNLFMHGNVNTPYDGLGSQTYFIDGQALGPENFGFTDPLTNTWRPKKYTGNFNIGSSDYTGIFAPYSTSARFNSFKTYTNLNENATSYTLPMGNPSHYGGKVLDLASGGFQVQTNNSAAGDFFMAIWVNLDSYETSKQMGVDIAGNYVYFETVSNGAIKIRHTGSGGTTSNSGYANDTNQWQHWALSRSGGSLRAFVDGEQIVTDTGGISGNNTVLTNSKFNFFGADNNTTSYNINGQVIDAVIYIGQGVSGNFTPPTAPLIDSSGNINHYSGFSDSQLYFASPLVDVSGSDPNTISDYYTTGTNSFYLPMDGNSPIGKDMSGRGNDWTPVRSGNTNKIDSPDLTGGTPILNTNEAGNVALPGYFGQNEYRYYTVSSSSGGGNPYIFDDVGTQPTFSFVRGAKYVFDYSSATSHPLRFATAADAAGSTQYTTGTVVSGNTITFTVPHDAPSTLYYYCTNHSGMGNSISVTTDTKRADPYAQNLVCALPLTGGEGGTSFNDIAYQIKGSGSSKSFTAFTGNSDGGGTTSTRGSVLYGSSFYTTRGATNANAGDYIERTGDSDLSMGTGDYCIEFWFHPYDYTSNDVLIDTRHPTTDWPNDDNGMQIYVNVNGDVAMVSNGVQISGSGVVGKNQDNHFALTREGTTERLFVNGNLIGTATNRTNDYNRDRLHLGSSAPNGEGSSGYYNDLRVYKGVAKYTSSFKVGSPNPTVLPDTPSGVSGRSKLTKITDGAVAFDGTGDYLRVQNHADLRFGSGDFCVEGFVYYTETSGNGTIAGLWNSGDDRRSWLLQIESDARRLRGFYSLNGSSTVQVNGTTGIMQQNSWHHVALTRNGNDIRLFLNGIQIGSASESGSFYDNSDDDIGVGSAQGGSSADPITGYLSNVRIVKGSAVYTHNFTPPTEPLTNVTNTKLLCCQSNTSAIKRAVGPGSYTLTGVDYSSGTQVTGSTGLTGKDNLFNGYVGTYTDTDNYAKVDLSSDNYILWTPTTGISYSSKVEIYCYAANGYDITNTYSLNGGGEQSFTGGASNFNDAAWVTVATGSGTLTSLKVRLQRGGGNSSAVNWYAIRIDGTVLTNNFGGIPLVGNGDASPTNFNPFNTDINTVRGQESGYCTLNPLDSKSATITENNLKAQVDSDGANFVRGTIAVSSGKWYFEFTTAGSNNMMLGALDVKSAGNWGNGDAFYYYGNGGALYGESRGKASSWGGSTLAVGDTLGVALDMDNGTIAFYKNGISIGTAWTGMTGRTVAPAIGTGGGSGSITRCNFGQTPFKFPPPDGFQPLNSANTRPVKVISRPDQYVGIITYTGNGTTGQSIKGLNFNTHPDLVWIKSRSFQNNHHLFDSVRGPNKILRSSTNETEDSSKAVMPSFDFNGFSVDEVTDNNATNDDGSTFVAWCWKAGGNKNTFNVDDVGYASASNVNMSVGALNSVAFDQSATWSNSLTASNGFISGSYDATKAFNGSTSGNHSGTNSGGTLTFSPNLTIPANSIIEVYSGSAESARMDITVNGVPNNSTPGGRFVKVNYDGSTTLTSLTVYRTGGGNSADLRGIRINGKLLVDSGVTVNAPSIAPTGCSVGTKQGFSIIRYQANSTAGASIPHGLSQAPNFVLVKSLETAGSSNSDWTVFHSSLGGTKALYLNQSSASGSTGSWNDTEPNAHVITLGTAHVSNLSPNHYIAYAWHDVPGLQKFGKYVGNNSADGPFVELGFKPALLWIKSASAGSSNWLVVDSTRSPHNIADEFLRLNTNGSETDSDYVDLLSNGFKVRANPNGLNSSSDTTVIYAAWAEAPSMNLFGAQSNAR